MAIRCWLLAGTLAVAGCESQPAQRAKPPVVPVLPAAIAPPVPAASAPPAPPADSAVPAALVPAPRPTHAPLKLRLGETTRYHRYVGTLGARPVVVELYTGREYPEQNPPKLSGHWHDAQSGEVRDFFNADFYARQRLRLRSASETDSAAHWQMRQPLGPLLTGTVTVAGQPRRRFVLREDYTGAVQLAIRTAAVYGQPIQLEVNERGEPVMFTGHYARQYVQLLGSAARRPALQRLFPSRPAQVRAWLRRGYESGEGPIATIDKSLYLHLNDYGILSYSEYTSDYEGGSAHPSSSSATFSYDMRTGRPISMVSLFKPGSLGALDQLVLRHLDPRDTKLFRKYYNAPGTGDKTWHYLNWEEPVWLTLEGLASEYALGFGADYHHTAQVIIPYAALRPLLRARTPLNRVLVARGLPPVL